MEQQPRPNEQQSIKNLQRYLRQLSFDDPAIPAPPIDGIFESVTENALRAYQKKIGLAASGVADLETWTRLFDDYNTSLIKNSRGKGFYIFPRSPSNYVLSPNEESFLLLVVQYILNELRILYDDIPPNGQSGKPDDATIEGILAFQKRNKLNTTGQVDLATWNALADAHRRMTDRHEL